MTSGKEYLGRGSNKMDRFFTAARKYGLHELPISALSQMVRECGSNCIHVRRLRTTCDGNATGVSSNNARIMRLPREM